MKQSKKQYNKESKIIEKSFKETRENMDDMVYPPLKQGWKKDFWGLWFSLMNVAAKNLTEKEAGEHLIKFISDLLAQERRETEKMIKEIQKIDVESWEWDRGNEEFIKIFEKWKGRK